MNIKKSITSKGKNNFRIKIIPTVCVGVFSDTSATDYMSATYSEMFWAGVKFSFLNWDICLGLFTKTMIHKSPASFARELTLDMFKNIGK